MNRFLPRTILREGAAGGDAGGGAGAAGAGAGAGAAAGAAGAAAAGAAAGGAAAATPPPFYKGLYGDDGKIDKSALDRLPDHLKPFKDTFGKYETVDALLGGFGNAHALASKKALTPLDPAAPDHVKAERKAMLDQVLNVPKEAKGYGIARPQDFPEEHWNEAAAGEFATLAHKHSLSPDAVRDILALQVKSTKSEIEKGGQIEAEFYKAQDDRFAAEVGKKNMDPAKALDLATRGANTLGIDPKSPLFKNADVKLACIRMAALVGEDKLVDGNAPDASGGKSELDQARDILRNPQNPDHKAYHDPMDPRNESIRARVNELYRIDGEKKRKRGVPAP